MTTAHTIGVLDVRELLVLHVKARGIHIHPVSFILHLIEQGVIPDSNGAQVAVFASQHSGRELQQVAVPPRLGLQLVALHGDVWA